jgi:hypothetical protein
MNNLKAGSKSWNDSDVRDFGISRVGRGILLYVGYAPLPGRFENSDLQATITEFGFASTLAMRGTFNRRSQTNVGFNGETTLINSRFYVAIGSPFPPHEGRTNEDCLEDVLELFTTLISVMEMSKGVKGIRLAMGACIGQICSVAIRNNDSDQINIAGEAYDQARNLMSWTEDQTALKSQHCLTIDARTYESLSVNTQLTFSRGPIVLGQSSLPSGMQLFTRNIPAKP